MTEDTSPENLRKFLESDDPALVRMGLSMAKGSGVPEEVLPAILKLYMWDDDKTVRAAAKSVFNKYAPSELQAKVKKNWKSSYRNLSINGDKFQEIIGILLKPFTSQDDLVKVVLYPLLKAVHDPSLDWRLHWDAMRRLGRIGDARAVETLIKALPQSAAIYALADIGDSRAVEPLINLLEEEIKRASPTLKEKILNRVIPIQDNGALDCVAALAQIGDTRAVEPIIKLLEEQPFLIPFRLNDMRGSGPSPASKNIYKNPAISLGKIGGKRAFDTLKKSFTGTYVYADNDENYQIKNHRTNIYRGVAEGLGYLGDKRAVGELLEALIVSNPEKEGSYNQQNYKLYGLMIKEIEMNPDSEKIFKPEERPKEVRKEYSDIYVQWNVIKSLGLLKDVRALEPLMKAFETRFSTRSIGNEVILALKNIIKAIGETTDTKEIKLLMTFYFRKYTLPDTYYVKTELYELGNKALVKIARANIQSKEKDNIIKFLKSDDPGMVMMGASMLKGILEE